MAAPVAEPDVTARPTPILVFLSVIVGGGLGGVIGAVPALAVRRSLFDFFRVRLKIDA